MGALDRFASARLCDHVREGETRQVLAHVVAHVGPYREQDTLTLVVTGPVAVGFAEVARDDRTVDGGDDLGEGNRFGAARQHVAPANPSF